MDNSEETVIITLKGDSREIINKWKSMLNCGNNEKEFTDTDVINFLIQTKCDITR